MTAAAIKLGSSTDCHKSGRYARLSGTFWRHRKTEQCGDAALGLLMRIHSFCADQGVSTVSERRMLSLFRGSHGRRNLNELLAAGFLEKTPEGYEVHDWYDHNRVRKPELSVIPGGRTSEPPTPPPRRPDGEPTANLWRAYGEATANAPPEIIEEPPGSRARATTQDPGPRELLKNEEHRGAEPPPRREHCSSLPFTDAPVTEVRATLPAQAPPETTQEAPEGAAEPPSARERIRELESRYGAPETLRETREACALSRRNGRMTDGVWAQALATFAPYPMHVALQAMQTFNEKYADGEKNERYLLGIMRGVAKRGVRKVGLSQKERDALNMPTPEQVERGLKTIENWLPLGVELPRSNVFGVAS